VSIIENKKRRTKNTQKEKYIVKNLSGIIDGAGYLNLVIDPKLPDYFTIEVVINETQEKLLIRGSKVFKRHPKNKNRFLKDEFSRERILSHIAFEIIEKPATLLIDSESIEMIYSDKPKALFLVTPPNRNEYNAIVSLLIDQLFNANYEVALSAGRKTTNRIQFILDEFANIPMIPSMDQKLSIGLGQNIQFMLIVQNLEQIEDK
ncbi:type IV secretory system conjugative DNA transfer family protein, partial [Enterococcus cecorum]|nr:type IV secretory system conjugative DNA transfer family protein [Enterococcus cecorum]